jgi:FKBP-type peptidyl-prolyl cis-trans isomerase SlyD
MVAPVPVAAQRVVTIEYTLRDEQGEVLDTSVGKKPLAYLHGAQNLVPGLERALEGKEPGAEIEVTVSPEDGYGIYDPKLVQNIAIRKLPERKAQVGMAVRVDTKDGPRRYFVTAVRGDYASLNGNHPLAGKTLHFKVKVLELRDATAEELQHGHVHEPGGHHH